MHWTYLHWFLSSKLENPGMPDRPVCDDEWFVTYGYILLVAVAGDDGLPSELVNGLPSDVDVVNAELLFWLLAMEELLLLLLWWFNDATDDDNCELINGWNCVYFGSILSNRNFDIARVEPEKKRNAFFFWWFDCSSVVVETNTFYLYFSREKKTNRMSNHFQWRIALFFGRQRERKLIFFSLFYSVLAPFVFIHKLCVSELVNVYDGWSVNKLIFCLYLCHERGRHKNQSIKNHQSKNVAVCAPRTENAERQEINSNAGQRASWTYNYSRAVWLEIYLETLVVERRFGVYDPKAVLLSV